MKLLFSIAFTVWASSLAMAKGPVYKTPLSRYSKEWDNPIYQQCNTAKLARYMSKEERDIIFVLNMIRMNPQLFRSTILRDAYNIGAVDTTSTQFFKTLDSTIAAIKPLPLLTPDSLCAYSARLHAVSSGITGYHGHSRQSPESKKATHFSGECCYYGSSDTVVIVLTLLVDNGVPSLGHRNICLGTFKTIGTGIAKHKYFGYIAVLDFGYR